VFTPIPLPDCRRLFHGLAEDGHALRVVAQRRLGIARRLAVRLFAHSAVAPRIAVPAVDVADARERSDDDLRAGPDARCGRHRPGRRRL